MTSLKMLRVIVCCTCLAEPIYSASVDDSSEGEKPDYWTIREQLDSRVRALFGRFRIGGGNGGGSNSSRAAGSKLTDGSLFFRNGFKLGPQRATTLARAKDAEDGGITTATEESKESSAGEGSIAGEGSTTAETATTAAGATTTTANRRVKFATELECTSANGGRPCVCLVADFLARLRRTDDVAFTDETAASEYECPSYVAAPKTFVVSPATASADPFTAATLQIASEASSVAGNDSAATDDGTTRTPVDFDHVVHYSLYRSKDDHYAVHYGLVSNDLKVRCLQHLPESNGTNITSFKWDTTAQYKSNSTVVGSNTNILMILGLDPKDSKNYTCIVSTIDATEKTAETSYKHHVIVVEKPMYEIRGTTVYQTNSGGCKNKTINPVRNQLPGLVLNELCPDGSSGHACNVVVETFKCSEDENTLEVSFSIMQNDNLNSIIRSTKKGHNALYYQKMLASVSGIFAANLYTMMTIPIVSKYSLFSTHFKPDHDRVKIDSFVACPPGFGIREIFCGACPPHHYSSNISTICSKCPKGFHQPAAGSDSCTKCPNIFADGCSIITPVKNTPTFFFYVMVVICIFASIVAVVSCAFCCREEGENKDIKVIPRQIRKKFKRKKGYKLLDDTYDTSNETDTARMTSASSASRTTIKKVLKDKENKNKKQKVKISEPVTTSTYKKLAED